MSQWLVVRWSWQEVLSWYREILKALLFVGLGAWGQSIGQPALARWANHEAALVGAQTAAKASPPTKIQGEPPPHPAVVPR